MELSNALKKIKFSTTRKFINSKRICKTTQNEVLSDKND